MGSIQHPDQIANLSNLLYRAADDQLQGAITVHDAAQIGNVRRITYGELLHLAQKNLLPIHQIKGIRRDSVMLLHFDNHLDGIVWFWSVVLAGYLPTLSSPFVH